MPPKRRTPASRKRQTTLNFFPSSPSARHAGPSSTETSTSAPASALTPATTPKKRLTEFAVVINTLATHKPTVTNTIDSSDDEEPVRAHRPSCPAVIDDDDESDIQTITPRRLLTPRSAKGKEVAVASESDEDITPRVRRIRSDVKEDDESDAAGPESKRRRRSTQTQARLSGMGSKWASRTDVQNDRTDTQMTDTDDTQMMLRPPDKDGSEESDGLEILSPTRRKPAEGSEKGEEEETGLGSDYELALKTKTVETRTRNAGGPKKLTPYQRRLAKLKSQRERRNTGEPTTSQPGADSNSEDESDEYDEEYGTNECGLEDVFSDAKQGEPEAEDEEGQGDSIGDSSASFYRTNDLDSNLTDFVVQDTADDLLGAPDDAEMPLEFTSASHDANPDQFRIYCQFLIYSVLFPGMVAKDERVENAIRRLEASTAGFGDSVVRSGAWRPEFDRALRARPILETRDCYPVEHCDACNRNNQNCGHKVQFRGRRYNKDTLDDLSSDEDEETDDSLGNKLGGEDQEFALGSMCFTRTKQAHALYHWKKELKGCVKAELERRGYIDEDGEVLNEEVEGMDEKEKGEWAEGICESMKRNISDLYDDFRRTIKTARESMAPGKWRSNAKRAFI